MFHEFGHALHGLLSQVTFPTLSGTNVARDFVEFPSQLFEYWLETPALLERFALHHETKEPLPAALVAKIKATSTFNQGFATVEYLSCALYDMRLHMQDVPQSQTTSADLEAFENATLSALGMPSEIVMRHRPAHFAHIFSSDSYSAGYYSYMWADTLVADAAEAFEQSPGGYYDKQVGQRYLAEVLTKGNSVDPADAFRRFRSRDVDTKALLRKRGFPTD
jgi:peptidyl-dipeptidase Dcp